MYIPLLSDSTQRLYPRKGGGGGGRGGGGHSSSGKGGSGGKGGSSARGSSVPVSGSTAGRKVAASYGSGGTPITTIPYGQPFAGRQSGGGTRNQVFGTYVYGSGYPEITGRGVANRNFPFVFWPISYPQYPYYPPYLYANEYGTPNNSSRPGGAMAQAMFASSSTNTTFHVLADNATVVSLMSSIRANCTLDASSSTVASPYNGSDPADPRPEQAIQYYRASSAVLTLDGYNDTSILSDNTDLPPVPLPTNIDTALLACLNATIAEAVPLFSGADARWIAPGMNLLVSCCWCGMPFCGDVVFRYASIASVQLCFVMYIPFLRLSSDNHLCLSLLSAL
ncbi:hypothetical protein A0H81_12166 [Grifola frondosa]|uniref:Uncharacterized protein n=1 Tax=Grifola frondosa TaxID=5627 RepID=A0A1C7LV55_GRIFR|nr:hypothetical protein A0H81_12166 [Grifola frondosa]